MEYLLVKWVHILSSMLLFGTGIGSAFYMFFISLTRDVRAIAVVAGYVVIADWLFTAPTVILQPLTGWYLIKLAGFPWASTWLGWSVGLYIFAIGCWLPVVWLQLKMRDLARAAAQQGTSLPEKYWRFFRAWTALGFAALLAFVGIIYLMVAKTP